MATSSSRLSLRTLRALCRSWDSTGCCSTKLRDRRSPKNPGTMSTRDLTRGFMNRDTHILMVEDLATDTQLIELELRKAGIDFVSKRVETKGAFLKALAEFQPDIVLSDYSLPQFSGLDALRLLKQSATP